MKSKKNGKLSAFGKKAEKALKDAVRKVIEEHAIRKIPLVVWENGKIKEIQVRRYKIR
ncbi:MAG: hypothetical protein PHE88_02775 [Elusimicrobia bacterium]|nr:hypothetical protein [Elusimicrobiota bacterium]